MDLSIWTIVARIFNKKGEERRKGEIILHVLNINKKKILAEFIHIFQIMLK